MRLIKDNDRAALESVYSEIEKAILMSTDASYLPSDFSDPLCRMRNTLKDVIENMDELSQENPNL